MTAQRITVVGILNKDILTERLGNATIWTSYLATNGDPNLTVGRVTWPVRLENLFGASVSLHLQGPTLDHICCSVI